MRSSQQKATKLDYKQVVCLVSVNFSQGVMLTTPFTLGVYMVRDFLQKEHPGQPVDERAVGQLTGLLAAAFSFAQVLTAYYLGAVSNYTGRKPVIIAGSLVSYISLLWYGASGSYANAVAARCFGGFFNGVLGAWKCAIGESTDIKLQGVFFGYMSLAWGLGCIAGPAIGGIGARPCEHVQVAGCGEGQLLRERPYFLACFVGSFTLLASLLLSILVLKETLPPHAQAQEWPGLSLLRALTGWPAAPPPRPVDDSQVLLTRHGAKSDGFGEDEEVGHTPGISRGGANERRVWFGRAGRQQDGLEFLESSEPNTPAIRQRIAYTLRLASRVYLTEGVFHRRRRRVSGTPDELASLAAAGTVASSTDEHGLLEASNSHNAQPLGQSSAAVTNTSPHVSKGGDGASEAEMVRLIPGPSSTSVTSTSSSRPALQLAAMCAGQGASALPNLHMGSSSPAAGALGRAGGCGNARLAEDGLAGDTANGALRAPHAAKLMPDNLTAGQSVQLTVRAAVDDGEAAEDGRGRDRNESSVDGAAAADVHWREAGQPAGSLAAGGMLSAGLCQDTSSGSLQQGPGAYTRSVAVPIGGATAVLHTQAHGHRVLDGPAASNSSTLNGRKAAILQQGSATGSSTSEVAGRDGQGHASACAAAAAAAASVGVGAGVGSDKGQEHSQAEPWRKRPSKDDSCTDEVLDEETLFGPSLDEDGLDDRDGARSEAASVKPPWHKDTQVLLTVCGYGLTALLFCAIDETFPIYAAAPRAQGGLGMNEHALAAPLMFFGIILMGYSLLGYPFLQRQMGTRRLTRLGLVVSVLCCLMLPTVSLAVHSAAGAGILLYSAMIVKAFAQCSAFTGAIILVNAAPRQEDLGTVNGVGQTLAALVRGLGPAMGGILWALSLGLHFAGHQFFTFVVISLVSLGGFLLFGQVHLPGVK